jgi:hypothetical protein
MAGTKWSVDKHYFVLRDRLDAVLSTQLLARAHLVNPIAIGDEGTELPFV